MAGFLKDFLLDDAKRLMGNQGFRLFLSAFGKHPGWDDHIEDIGLDTDSLVAAKQNLYVNGIGRQIDSGAWEKLGAEQGLPGFKHNFAWVRGRQFILGRMWSSSDGKGRTRYPMVVCCHCVDLPFGITARKVFPLLANLEEACKGVKTAAEVRNLISRYLNEMRFAICDLSEDTCDPATLTETERKVLDAIGGDAQMEGMLRVMYQVQTHMGAFMPGKFSIKTDPASARPQHVRVAAVPVAPLDSLFLWSRLLRLQLDPASPRLFWLPDGEPWLDVIVGEPSEQEYFALRANSKALPLASEVPYNFDSEFRGRTLNFLADFRMGKFADLASQNEAVSKSPTTSFTRRFFKSGKKWFGGVALLGLVIAALAFKFFAPSDVPQTKNRAPVPVVVAQVEPPAKQDPPIVPKVELAAVPKPQPATTTDPPKVVQAVPKPAASIPAIPPAPAPQPEIKLVSQPVVTPPPVAVGASPARAVEVAANRAQSPTAPEKKSFTNSIGMEFVRLPENIWAGRYEVTQAEFQKVAGSNPSRFQGGRFPVENVSWNEAVKFCEQLTALDQKVGTISKRAQYTLPTEKQWELLLADANFQDAVTSRTSTRTGPDSIGSGKMNRLGLYDVLGNVWEWCLDGAPEKVLKGSGYNSRTTQNFKPLTETTPLRLAPDAKVPHAGFRCLLLNYE